MIWRQLDIDLGARPRDVVDEVFARIQPAIEATKLWFVRKPPGLRVRVRTEPEAAHALALVADGLRDDGIALCVREAVYEPEVRRFGGARAMDCVHSFFHLDSRAFVAWYLDRARARLAPAVASFAVVAMLFEHLLAGADSEIWDAWANLAAQHGIAHHHASAKPLHPPTLAQLQAMAAEHESVLLADYERGCHTLADEIAALRREGDLQVGVRAFAADVALFHWNRWGIADAERHAMCEGALVALHPHRRMPRP